MRKSVLLLFLLFCKSFAELDTEWWRHTIIYEILPFSFKDSDGDGMGDIRGITSKLDHFVDLGIETIHLTPIFKTTMKDIGYDITDYYEIDSRYGTMKDFDELMSEMKKRDLKLILDLVINHSGHENEWFQKSIDKIDPYTDFYVWRDPKEIVDGVRTPPNKWRSIFQFFNLGSAWTWNEKRQQFYMHQFLPEQPDFKLNNEHLKDEIKKIITFWLDKGVAGFRLDAAPHFFEDREFRDDGYESQINQPETYEFIHELRLFLNEYNIKHGGFERIFLAEVRGDLSIMAQYYGSKTYPLAHYPYSVVLEYVYEPWNSFDFYWNIMYWMILVPKEGVSVWTSQDHDCNRIGTRVSPEYSDLITMISMMLPGAVGMYYGQEIAMINGFITPGQIRDYSGYGGRDPARLPMQWDDSTSGGFSTNKTTFLPLNSDYFKRNVESQKNDKSSHYNLFKDLSALRKTAILKQGNFWHTPLYPENIYLIARSFEGHECVLLVNLDLVLLRVNLTNIMRNSPNEVSIAAASTNTGYRTGSTLDNQVLNKFEMPPLSGIVLRTYHPPPKTTKRSKDEDDQ